MQFVWFILIGLIAGWLAGVLVKGSGFGILGDICMGILGALIGGFLFSLLGIQAYSLLGAIIVSTIGAVVLICIVRALKKA